MTMHRALTEPAPRGPRTLRGAQCGAGKTLHVSFLNSLSANWIAPARNALQLLERWTAVSAQDLKRLRLCLLSPVPSGAEFDILMIVEEDQLIKRMRRKCQ